MCSFNLIFCVRVLEQILQWYLPSAPFCSAMVWSSRLTWFCNVPPPSSLTLLSERKRKIEILKNIFSYITGLCRLFFFFWRTFKKRGTTFGETIYNERGNKSFGRKIFIFFILEIGKLILIWLIKWVLIYIYICVCVWLNYKYYN